MLSIPTQEEIDLKEVLERRGLRVLSQVPDGHKHINLAIPSAKINIEVDGISHLINPYQILSDLDREEGSEDLGYSTIHIQNEEIKSNLEKIAEAITEASRKREKYLINKNKIT